MQSKSRGGALLEARRSLIVEGCTVEGSKSANTRSVGSWRGKELCRGLSKIFGPCTWRAVMRGRRRVHGKPAPKAGEEFQLGKTNINPHCSEWSW